MFRSRIFLVAVALLVLSFAAIDAATHLARHTAQLRTSSSGPEVRALDTRPVAGPATQPTRSMVPERRQPAKQTGVADARRPPNLDLVERLQRELSSQQAEIKELRERSEKRQARDDGVHQDSGTSKSLAMQFDDFAERFVAAVDTAIQNSKPSSDELNGTRKLKVTLISDELTNSGADQLAQGVVLLRQSCDFLSDDGRITWSREWVFRFSFEMQHGRWHCLGGTCRMAKDDNPSYGGKSPHIGEVLNVPEGTWDDLDIR